MGTSALSLVVKRPGRETNFFCLVRRPRMCGASITGHGCEIEYCHWFRRFVREGVCMFQLGLRFKWNTLYLFSLRDEIF
jgi:hypothetical protein